MIAAPLSRKIIYATISFQLFFHIQNAKRIRLDDEAIFVDAQHESHAHIDEDETDAAMDNDLLVSAESKMCEVLRPSLYRLVGESILSIHKFHKYKRLPEKELPRTILGREMMSAEIVVPRSIENKNIGLAVKCLLWRVCPVFTQKEKGCLNKGSSACKEFIRLQFSADMPYKGDSR